VIEQCPAGRDQQQESNQEYLVICAYFLLFIFLLANLCLSVLNKVDFLIFFLLFFEYLFPNYRYVSKLISKSLFRRDHHSKQKQKWLPRESLMIFQIEDRKSSSWSIVISSPSQQQNKANLLSLLTC